MKLTLNIKKNLFLATFVAAVSACSSTPTVQDFPDTASPNAEVVKFETDIVAARENQVDVLSPYNFKKAQDSLQDAKKSLDKQRDSKDILHEVALGRSYLIRSNEFAELAHSNIGDVITARQQAVAAGAPTVHPKDFENADERLTDVTANIEKNKLEDAIKNRSALQLEYLDLELRTIKQTKLIQARDTIAQAVKEGAKVFAPRSLAIAEKSVKDTDAYITANRHEASQIDARSIDTRKSAEHLLKITRESKSGKKTSSEETALQMENHQLKTAETQDQLNTAEGQIDSKNSQIAKGNSANAALTNANLNLEAEQAMNQRYEDARAQFTESEAMVYKQGNSLMIRLRGLEFTSARAELKGSNFPLLVKVQKVIREFGKSSVTIEGHTDSVGGMALNEKLSTERAQAVKDYLVSNSDGQTMNIKSVGYGYQKPLATNKTSSGRAQNRRVDVLIQPDSDKVSYTK